MSSVSKLDKFYKRILHHRFFRKGWGDPECYERLAEFRKILSNRETTYKLIPDNYSVEILTEQISSEYVIYDGKFKTPLACFIPEVVPEMVRNAYFQLVVPKKWQTDHKSICIHYAATGDHFFWRRRNVMAKPLLKYDIGSIIIENPYYGLRKPKDQFRSSLHHVSDILIMGASLMLETLVILHWCERMGFGPLGLTGLSMGGHMASLSACNWPKPLVLVPCLSWSTGSSVFTDGVLSNAIDWDLLQNQYKSNEKFYEILSKKLKIVDDPFAKPNFDLLNRRPNNIVLEKTPHEMLQFFKQNTATYFYPGSPSKVRQRLLHLQNHMLGESSLNYKMKNRDAIWFMIGVMDEFTHLKNYSVPYDTSLVIAICATSDGYIPRVGCSRLEDLWPGITVRYLDTGHVGAHIWHGKSFKQAIIDAFDKAKTKLKVKKKAI